MLFSQRSGRSPTSHNDLISIEDQPTGGPYPSRSPARLPSECFKIGVKYHTRPVSEYGLGIQWATQSPSISVVDHSSDGLTFSEVFSRFEYKYSKTRLTEHTMILVSQVSGRYPTKQDRSMSIEDQPTGGPYPS